MRPTLGVIILAGNEQQVISDALKSVIFADEITLVAANSTDQTIDIARQLIPNIKIISTFDEYGKNFSKWRNLGLESATTDWILYVDADERVSRELQKEILEIINNPDTHDVCFAIPRANYFLGQRVRHGNTYPDYVRRLYHRTSLKRWEGILHEQPVFMGTESHLKNDLIHYTHRDLTSMLQKTIVWTDSEAQALYDAGHPPVVWWRFIRMMLTKIFERLIVQKMFLDGIVGWISVIFETFDTFIIYARLWEKQQHK